VTHHQHREDVLGIGPDVLRHQRRSMIAAE